jgi:hypothetical protein
VPVVDVEVAVSGACTHRSEERQGSKVLAGSPLAGLAPRCDTSATSLMLNAAFDVRSSWVSSAYGTRRERSREGRSRPARRRAAPPKLVLRTLKNTDPKTHRAL